jgi:hypothetical protein
MKLPTRLKIGGKYYKVEYVDKIEFEHYNDPNGLILWREDVIKIKKGMSEVETELTILHEIIHGINCNMPEEQVEYLAQALYGVIHDNKLQFAAVKGNKK